jgi:hypothetical protein
MKRAAGVLFLACLLLLGCRVTEQAEPEDSLRIYPSDEELIALAYDNAYDVPEGFLVDDRANTDGSYTVYHVKDASVSYEVCTDDSAEAAALEAEDNANRSVNGIFVDSFENDRYFEFVRELAYPDGIGNISDLTSPGFSRVFKCGYVNRDGVDRNLRNGYAGTLNVRPLNTDVVKELAEYLWQFTFFWPAQKTVLSAYSEERADAYEHTLTLAFVTNQGFDRCDLVELVDWTFAANRDSGNVTKSFQLIRQFEAELVNGTPTLCDG